jgi:hypothetical protein
MDTPTEKDWTTTTIMQQQLHENLAGNLARRKKKTERLPSKSGYR